MLQLAVLFATSSEPAQGQHALHPTDNGAASATAVAAIADQASIDSMSLTALQAEMNELLKRRASLCHAAERQATQHGLTSYLTDVGEWHLCRQSAAAVDATRAAVVLAAERRNDTSGNTAGDDTCPGHPNIKATSSNCPTAAGYHGGPHAEKLGRNEDAPPTPKKAPGQGGGHPGGGGEDQQGGQQQQAAHGGGLGQQESDQSQQGGENGHGQQHQESEESEKERVLDMEAVLIISVVLIILTMFFEWLRHWFKDAVPLLMANIVTAMFGELTVLGFIAVFLFFLLKSGFMQWLSEKLYHNHEHLIHLFEEVHFDLFFVMVVFLVQALILVYALMRAIHYWHGNYRDLREDRWGYACAELRQAYHSMDYAPLWRRIVLWPYRYYQISTLRAEVRLFMLRERFVYQGHSTTAIHSEPLPDMFNFAAYLRRRGAYMTGEILDMTPLTWFVVGIFLVLAVQSLVVLEVEVGHDPNYVEGCTMEVGSWILLIGTLTLFHRLSWTVEQITPPHPLLKGPDDDEEPCAGAAEQTAEEQKMDPEAGSPGKWIHQTISPPVIADTAGAASEANIGDRLGNIVRDTAGVIQGVEEAPSAFTKVSDGERPDRKWVQAEAPYEKRPAKKGVSKMESLFPFGHRGPGFYIFVIRVLFFSSAIMLTLCVQWLPRAPSTNILLIRVFLSLVPLIAILLFGPGRLLPLMVMVTSLEQFKDRRDLHDTAIEMKTESSLQTLRVLSVILSEASRAKKIAESLEKDDPGKRKPRRCLTGIMTTEDKSQKSLSKTSQKKKAVRAELNQQQLAELRTTFNLFDKDSSGDIDKGEFEQLMNTLGLRLPPHVLDGMFEEMDLSGDGHCEFEEFVDYMIEHGFASKEADGPDHIVKVMFDILDKDHSGTISTAELRQMMIDFGGNLTHQEIDIAMGMFDLDGSGQISKAEFRKAVDAMHTFAGSKHESHRTVVMTEHGRESGAAL